MVRLAPLNEERAGWRPPRPRVDHDADGRDAARDADSSVGVMADRPPLGRLVTGTLMVVSIASFSLLAVLSFLGLYVRPSADDWCVLWKTRDMGVLGITKDYYMTQNGRLSNAFVSGLLSLDGTRGMRLFPGFLIAAFGIGLVLLLRQIWWMRGWRAPSLALVTVAVVVELALFAGAYNPYQTLLWSPGSITHTLPTIVAVWAVYLGLRASGSQRRWVHAVSITGALLVGFSLGTLTEPSLVMLGLLAGTVGLFCIPRLGLVHTWHPFLWCTAACAGLVIGFAVLYTSPGAQLRRGQSNKVLPPMLSAPSLNGAAGDWLRIMNILTSQWTYLAVLAVGVLAGILTSTSPHRAQHDSPATSDAAESVVMPAAPPRPLIAACLILMTPLLLAGSYVVVLGVRSGYGANGWRDARVWFNFVAPMALAMCAYGVLLGRALQHVLARQSQRARAGTVAVSSVLTGAFLLLCAASLLSVVKTQANLTITRARAFDAQDAHIRAQVAGSPPGYLRWPVR